MPSKAASVLGKEGGALEWISKKGDEEAVVIVDSEISFKDPPTMWSTWNQLVEPTSSSPPPPPYSSSSSSSSSTSSSSCSSAVITYLPNRKRMFDIFCEKERPRMLRDFPDYSGDEIIGLLQDEWTDMTQRQKESYVMRFVSRKSQSEMSNHRDTFSPPPEPDNKCPGCETFFDSESDRQIIMKHWFKSHSLGDLHALYTSLLWKLRLPKEGGNSITPSSSPTKSIPSPFKKSCELLFDEIVVKQENSPRKTPEQKLVNMGRKTKIKASPRNGENVVSLDIKTEIKQEENENRCVEVGKHQQLEAVINCEYKPGDLVWARVGYFPIWPCVITIDPLSVDIDIKELPSKHPDVNGTGANVIPMEVEDEFDKCNNGIFSRISCRGKGSVREFHVDFFGSVQRAWAVSSQIIRFTGMSDFERDVETLKRDKKMKNYKRYNKSLYPSKQMRAKWESAVKDAESTINLTGPERINLLKHLQAKEASNTAGANGIARKRKRPSLDSREDVSEDNPPKKLKFAEASKLIASIPLKTLQIQKRKLKTGIKLFQLANRDILKKNFPKLRGKEVEIKLNTLWEALPPLERKFYRDEIARLLKGSLDIEDSSSSSEKEFDKKKPLPLAKPFPKPENRPSKPEMIGIFKNERCCIICEEVSQKPGDILTCKGVCGSSYHKGCIKEDNDASFISWKCKDCMENVQRCFICKLTTLPTTDNQSRDKPDMDILKCNYKSCSKFFHPYCLKHSNLWPQTIYKTNSLICPAHMCHTCASDNISDPVMKYNSKLMKCIRCPTTYHSGDHCVTAGTVQITSTIIICPKHYVYPVRNKKGVSMHVNVAWCFICSLGGSLICCDLCPASFHFECLNVPSLPEGRYYCTSCSNGRMPLYGEALWVKLSCYRWWPATVLHPSEVPANIDRIPHQMGEFPIKFCGSNEYYWINHGRSFLYEKGDSDRIPDRSIAKGSIGHSFRKGLIEAADLHDRYTRKKNEREAKNSNNFRSLFVKKPPSYQKIKMNRPYGDVAVYTTDSSEVQVCGCNLNSDEPCYEDSDCMNRILMVECQMSTCPAKERCRNMQFQRRTYPPLRVSLTDGRGWGLFVDKPIKKGRFIIEYVGELITMEEFRSRIRKSENSKEDQNFYYMTMDNNRMIDAGPKGNIARFMNHSCDPNCETQKWTVNGDTRVGIFTLKDIPAGSEITFNYQFEAMGEVKKTCLCGAQNCSGYIGKKPTSIKMNNSNGESTSKSSQPKKKVKKAKNVKIWEDVCFRCYKGGELLMCDHKTCPKVYHLACLHREKMPHGKWFCPWHHCVECGKSAVSHCIHCPNAYCKLHEEALSEHTVLKKICGEHDEEDIASLVEYYEKGNGATRGMVTNPNVPLKPRTPVKPAPLPTSAYSSSYKDSGICGSSFWKRKYLCLASCPECSNKVFKSFLAHHLWKKHRISGKESRLKSRNARLGHYIIHPTSPPSRPNIEEEEEEAATAEEEYYTLLEEDMIAAAAGGVTRTPSGRIRRIPSDLMKRVRCAYPGCDLAVIPSNFARHWKFKHTDMPQPPIESLTVVRGENSSDSGDVPLPPTVKQSLFPPPSSPGENNGASFPLAPAAAHNNNGAAGAAASFRNDGKERKRARQRNYICSECHRPLIGSNFGRHWASKHPDLPQPSLIDLEMEAVSDPEDEHHPHSEGNPSISKPVIKKRKVVCSECEMPMISSNFSRHWASRHPQLEMPQLCDLNVIDASETSPQPITIPYPEDEDEEDEPERVHPYVEEGTLIEPADEDFEDLEEIEDENDNDVNIEASRLVRRENIEGIPENDLVEVSVEPIHYNSYAGEQKFNNFGFGNKRHKKVYCSECNMPMLCNNFRRHFHRRHGEMLDRMPSIHTLKIVSDEDYELAQLNKIIPSSNHAKKEALLELPEHLAAAPTNGSPARVKRKVLCPECGMAMIASNFGRHWASKHADMPQPLLQDLEYAESGDAPEAETVVCEPLFFGPDDSSGDERDNSGEFDEDYSGIEDRLCGFNECNFSTPDPSSMSAHRNKAGHLLSPPKNNGAHLSRLAFHSASSDFTKPPRAKKVWKKKLICPECNLQTISSNFTRHWLSKHGHLPTPGLNDLEVITIDNPGFHNTAENEEVSKVVVEPTIYGNEDDDEGLQEGEDEYNDDQVESIQDEQEIEDDLDEDLEEVQEGFDETKENTQVKNSKLTSNKINCNFDINSLLEDDDEEDEEDVTEIDGADDNDDTSKFSSLIVS